MSMTRRRLGALALVGAPLLILATDALRPGSYEDGADVYALVTEQQGRWQLTALVGLLGFMLLVPAGIAAARFIRRTHPRAALATSIGIGASSIAIVGFFVFDLTVAAMKGGSATQMAAFYDRAGDSLLFPVLMVFAIVGSLVGIPALVYGLWRSHVVSVWVPIVILVGFTQGFVVEDVQIVNVVGDTLLAIGFGYLGWKAFWMDEPERAEVRRISPKKAAA